MKTTLCRHGLVCLTAVILSGCVLFDATRRAPGPDEFGVVTRAPLSQPPDFALRPPREGAQRPNELAPQQEARERLLSATDPAGLALQGGRTNPAGGVEGAENAFSAGETAFLKRAGALDADDEIRVLVDRESGRVREDDSLVNRLVFWRRSESAPGEVIDPEREAERLSRNAALGEPPTAGQTPAVPY